MALNLENLAQTKVVVPLSLLAFLFVAGFMAERYALAWLDERYQLKQLVVMGDQNLIKEIQKSQLSLMLLIKSGWQPANDIEIELLEKAIKQNECERAKELGLPVNTVDCPD